jgi:hypothetical protein
MMPDTRETVIVEQRHRDLREAIYHAMAGVFRRGIDKGQADDEVEALIAQFDRDHLTPTPSADGEVIREAKPRKEWTEREILAEAYSDAARSWTAPVQGYGPGIPWPLHLEAYDAYCREYSKQTALIDLPGRGCRGGFGTKELDTFIPGWRDRVSEITKLRAELAKARAMPIPTTGKASGPSWVCAAQKQGTAGGNDPADCDWPVCGCDPAASKVIADLEESGLLSLGKASATPSESDVERAGEPCRFVNCPPGLFRFAGMLCFKSEYSSKPGQQDAYCVDSGEYFWGGTNGDLEARRNLIVQPVAALSTSKDDLREALEAIRETAETRLNDGRIGGASLWRDGLENILRKTTAALNRSKGRWGVSDNLCPLCRGSGSVVTVAHGLQWWTCGICFGAGVIFQHGPARFERRRRQGTPS